MDIAPPQADPQGLSLDETADLEPVPGQPAQHRRLRHRLLRRPWLIAVGVVVLVGAAIGIGVGIASASSQPAPTYRAVAASTGTMRLTTAATGTLQPAQMSSLNFQVSGQVSTVNVVLGQQVKAGQALATVTSASLAAQVAQAKATLANDQAKLSADQTASASSSQLSADQAAVDAAQAALNNSQTALNDATLTSPITGTVAQLNLAVGQQVTGSGSSGSGSGGSGSGGSGSGGSGSGGAGSGGNGGSGSGGSGSGSSGSGSSSSSSSAQVVVVGGAFVVNLPVDDTQIGLMKNGEQAVIIPQGSATPVYGLVTSVGLLASSSSGVATFPVVVTVTGTPPGLFAGATANVTIVYRQLSNVLEVPTAALHYSGGKTSVQELRNGKLVSVPVTVGLTSGGYTQIQSGLSDGEQVLVQNTTTPRTGTSGGTGGGGRNGGGGFGGGGFGGGGFGGGGFGGGGRGGTGG